MKADPHHFASLSAPIAMASKAIRKHVGRRPDDPASWEIHGIRIAVAGLGV
jgi:hypothetical protein